MKLIHNAGTITPSLYVIADVLVLAEYGRRLSSINGDVLFLTFLLLVKVTT